MPVSAGVLKRLMGHKDIQTTMKYYVHIDADEIADELGERWSGSVGTFVGKRAKPETPGAE